MQSYVDNGGQSINTLIEYSTESFSTSSARDIQSKLSEIKIFYDKISLDLDRVEGITIINSWYITRVLLLVRRISRTLAHIVIDCQRKNKCFEELIVLLSNVYSECERIKILGNDLTNDKSNELRQFEDDLHYEKVLYEREIITPRVDTEIDIGILTLYLTHCITDNSSVYVNGLIDNLGEFLGNRGITTTVENYEYLRQCLDQLEIPLEGFLLKFEHDTRTQIEREHLRRELGEDRNISVHIDEHILHGFSQGGLSMKQKSKRRCITDIFKSDRYIVLLGDPGSGKSTFMRFVTQNLAINLLNSVQSIKEKQVSFARIPILIYLSLFAKECAEKESLSVIDYIESRENSMIPDAGKMLKDEIIKGNCILLFDGLDEVFTFESRRRVVHCVKTFIEQFALSPAFISPFDSWHQSLERSLNGELPSETNGNQILMTSRFIGYDATSLLGHRIFHYAVPPLEKEEKYKFINHWYSHVDQSLNKVLLSHNLIDMLPTCSSWIVHAQEFKSNIEKNGDLRTMTSNLLILSMLCARQYRYKNKPLPTLRIDLYEEYVTSVVRSRRLLKKTLMSEDMIEWILEDVAAYMHKEEPSGVIDRFVLKRVCVHSIQAFYKKYDNLHKATIKNLEDETDEFIRWIDQNAELLIARGQQIYGFIQMTFQEYFACLRLVRSDLNREDNVDEILRTLLTHIRKPRYLLPVLLSLEWLSCNWTTEGYNAFCHQLVSHDDKNQYLPVGALILIESLKNLNKKPKKSILYEAFDQFSHTHTKHGWFFHQPSLGVKLCFGLEALPTAQSSEWLLLYLDKATSSEVVDLSFLIHRYVTSVSEFPDWLDANVCVLLSRYIQYDIDNNEYAVEQLLCLVAERKHERLWKIRENSKGLEILLKSIAKNENQHHPLLVTILIALHGGLYGKEFNSLCIHRDSALSIYIAEYYDQINLPHTAKVTVLQERCETIIHQNEKNNTSLCVLDAFIVLLCLTGIHDRDLCEKYKFHRGFYNALRRLQNLLFYLRKRCACIFVDFSIDDEYLASIRAACPNLRKSVVQCTIKEENTSPVSIEAKILSSEYILAFMGAISTSVASLTLSIEHVQIETYESFPLYKWRISSKIWRDELCHFVKKYDVPWNIGRVIPEWISFLSMLIYSEDYIHIRYKDKDYLHKQFMQSIYDHTHIFYYTKDHPLFLVSFLRPHRRALFCRFLSTNSVKEDESASDDWIDKISYVYLLIECLDDFPNKYDNNICVFAFLLLLCEPILHANRLQYFAWVYFLKVPSERIDTLKTFLREVSGLFPSAQAIKSFDNKSALHAIEEQRQYLSKVLLTNSSPQRDFQLYTSCISLAHLSTIQCDDINALRTSLLKELQCGVEQIAAPFYRVHALNYCINFNNENSLSNLPFLFYFLMAEKLCHDGRYCEDVIERLNYLFHDTNNIEDRQAVCEALLPLKCFRKYILDNADKCLQPDELLILNRVLHIKSAVLHFFLENTDDFWCGKPSNSIITHHACLYLALLIIDAQSVLDEFEEQPIASLDLSDIKQKLKPSGYPPCLSVNQARAITEYLKNAFPVSKLDLIETALHRFDTAETDAFVYLRQWFQYQNSSRLKFFAWHASILLPIENLQQISILVDIFQSDNDHFLRKITGQHFIMSPSSDPSLLRDITERMIQAFRCETSIFPFSFLKKLLINRSELLGQLFQAEQQLISERLECDRTVHLLGTFRSEQKLIWEKLQNNPSILGQFVFDTSARPLARAFILEIRSVLDGANIESLSTITNRCLYLLSLEESFAPFHDFLSTNVNTSKEYFSINERCKTFVWEMILASNQDSIRDRLVLRKCIEFYCKEVWPLTEYNLSILQKIANESSHSDLYELLTIITDDLAIRTLYLNDESTRKYREKLDELYNTHRFAYDESTKVEQMAEYINKHCSSLLSIFAKDFIRSLTVASKGYVDLSRASLYGQVADHLCKLSTRSFHTAIRKVPQGELQFKELLYQIKCSELLAYYGELTSQLLELIFAEDSITEDNEDTEHEILSLINSVANRLVLEQLYQKLMSKYSFERFLAGRLVVRLALCDAISAQEAMDRIWIVLQDPFTQQQMEWFHADNKDCPGHHGLDQEMFQMLLQLSFAHREPLKDSVQPCHEPTMILHYAKQTRNQMVCLFTTNELMYVDEAADSNDSHNSNSDDGDINEDNISD